MTDQCTFIELQEVEPNDIPFGDEWDGRNGDAATDLANDIYELIKEDYPFEASGVAVVVNEEAHERLNEAFGNND